MSRGLLAALVALAVAAGAIVLATSGDGDGDSFEGPPPSAGSRTERWVALRGSELARTEVAAARIGRFIYVVGGFEERSGGTTGALERYDVRRNRWSRRASMPVGLNHPAAVAHRGKLYVHGGYTAERGLSGASARLYSYEPGRDRWRRLHDAPTRRAAHALGALGGRIYAAGGANERGALDTLEIYDLERRRWRRGPSLRTMPREHLAGATAGRFFYVLGGRAAGRGNFTVAERYDPRQRRWQRLPDMRKARGGIAAVRVGRRIVVFGGEESAGTIAEVEIYDPRERRWSTLPRMRTPRHGLGGVSLGHRVYSIEGGPTPGFDFSKAIEALDVR